jgi:hypothetical protein
MALDVKVVIDLAKTAGTLGFGYPLILEENATSAIAYAECSDINAVVKAGYATTTKVYKAAQLMFMQDHKPSKIAVCSCSDGADDWLGVEANITKGWRQLVVVNGGASSTTATTPAAISTIIEAAKTEKMYFANIDMPENLSSAQAAVTDKDRTIQFYYTATEDVPVPVAALAGEIGGLTPGAYTVNNMTLKGLTPLELSEDDISNIHGINGITFVLSAGDGVCSEGKTSSGEYIDIVDGNDYVKQQLEYRTQKVFNTNLKVPYTNNGIALLESAAIGVMQDAQNKGIVDSFEVTYALRENTTAEDRAARRYFGGNCVYTMQGAVHTVEIYCQANI